MVGPTCIGKTKLSLFLSKKFKSDIISCDSQQFYKEINICNSKVNKNILKKYHHHFINICSVYEKFFNIYLYKKKVFSFLNKYFKKKNIIIMVGGSMLYEKTISNNLNLIKYNLIKNNKKDISIYLEYIKRKDIKIYNTLDKNNIKKIINYYNILINTKKKISYLFKKKNKINNFKVIKIGLYNKKKYILNNINNIVNLMFKNNVIFEMKKIFLNKKKKYINCIGYKDLYFFFKKNITLKQLIINMKYKIKKYYKKQITWYKKDLLINWFYNNNFNYIYNYIYKYLI
ncbi:MAG: tRNA (adenosine(37)-N6)-dimethylallyltransferase MiaA [Candidatus Shikimatogenerans sp. Tduv]|uniref:tRNA dimethylallyltransferase n=1 Tax=Candidatus Shikimatogenerans sp. Tduv TaxID=3158567 RepID=A0AAU7QRN4_9FLAO